MHYVQHSLEQSKYVKKVHENIHSHPRPASATGCISSRVCRGSRRVWSGWRATPVPDGVVVPHRRSASDFFIVDIQRERVPFVDK